METERKKSKKYKNYNEYITEQAFLDSYSTTATISDKQFNLLFGGAFLYGIVINILMCYLCPTLMITTNNPIVYLLCLICPFIGIFMVNYDNFIQTFIAYHLVIIPIGLDLTMVLYERGGIEAPVVLQAFILTGIITMFMFAISITFPRAVAGLGRTLFISLVGLILTEIVLMFLGIEQYITSIIGALIFTLYIGYDFYKAQQYIKTKAGAIYAALGIYLDVVNLFLRLLRILGKRK